MNDQNFEKLDKEMMKSTQPLREKRVSEGILKGFSASVERRLEAKKKAGSPSRALSPAWIPAFAVMLVASVVVLRLPLNSMSVAPVVQTMDYAQLDDAELDIDAEIEALKALGVWDENDDGLLGTVDADMEELEYSSQQDGSQASIA